MADSRAAGLVGLLEAEFRQLSQDAKKSEGGLASFFSAADHPEVKEAAERAVLKVRSLAEAPDALEQIRAAKELLRPLQLACDTKSPKLVGHALSTAQKMLANGAMSPEGTLAVVGLLAKVEKSGDENVQLKVLQTALTLLQSQWHPTSVDDIGAVLGICFRMLSSKGHKDTVVSTATATVRQAVALVFSYVDVGAEQARIARVLARDREQAGSHRPSPRGSQQSEAPASPTAVVVAQQDQRSSSAEENDAVGAAQEAAVVAEASAQSVRSGLQEVQPSQQQQEDDAPASTVQAAHKLLEDLCAIAAGAPPQWLKTPSLPRTFVLEILDFVLTNSAPIFRALPAFENTLSVWISQLLMSQLQDHLDAGAAGSSMAVNSFHTFRAVLRTMRTVLRGFYPQIGMRSGAMVQGLLRGLHPKIPLFQRIAVMQTIKHLLGDACFVYFLFSAYDMQPDLKFQGAAPATKNAGAAPQKLHYEIVQATVQSCTDIVEGMLRAANKDPEDDPPLELVTVMSHHRAQGKDWTMDTDFEAAPVQLQSAYLSLLAIDSLMAFMGSVEKLTEFLTLEGGAVPASVPKWPGSVEHVNMETCQALVGRNWRKMLSVFRELLSRCNGEAVILQLLKGYQVFTQACGMLEMVEPRDAFLGTLCEFALANPGAELETSSPGARAAERLASPRGDHEGGLVLAPKNVQSMRALFNIAHRLSNVLGPAWPLVLETMNTLDTILHSPHTTAQEVSNQAGEEPVCSDVAILAAAASQMFECTREMTREAVVSLLSGLRDVSVKHIPQAVQVQQPKLFALNRMVEVLLYNKARIYDLWAIFLSHVLELASDAKAPVRVASIDALDRAIVGTLGSPKAAVRRTQSEAEAESPQASQEESAGGVEYMLLVALESLYTGNAERDVQLGVLRTLLNVLQRHGEHLSDGWTPVFRLLASVPAQKDAERIDLAFQSVQLTCSDYMAAMPFPRMKRCLEVAAMYGSQQVDLNVSLTAISLLWNAADMLGRGSSASSAKLDVGAAAAPGEGGEGDVHAAEQQEEEEEEEEEAPVEDSGAQAARAPGAGQGPARKLAGFSTSETEDLLQLVFVALQCLSMDLRPEVRNSGVRTLFAVIVNQGPRLSKGLWERCLWEMVFPLLRHSYRMSANSDKEETEAQLLGSTRGKQVRLLVHHSRNSEQKQWDETVVIALGGMGRLLKAHLPAVARLEGFPAAWEELMVVVESSMAGGRKEVALAAMMLLGGVLQAHAGLQPIPGEPPVVSEEMWKRAMRAVDVGVEAATTPTCQVPLQARIELVNMLGSAYSTMQQRFDEEDTQQVFFWLERFCRSPWSDDDAANTVQVAIGLPPVQKAVLALLPSLAPSHLPHLWPELIYTVVRFLRPRQVLEAWRQQQLARQQQAAAAVAAAAALQQQQAVAQQNAGAAPRPQPQPQPAALPAHVQQQHGAPAPVAGAAQQPAATGASGQEGVPSAGSSFRGMPTAAQQQQKQQYALSSAFLEKVLEVLVVVYRDVAPTKAKSATFAAVVTALGRCMEVRSQAFSEPLWRHAAQAFIAIVPAGLPAVAATWIAEGSAAYGAGGATSGGAASGQPGELPAEDPTAAWAALATAFEGFLLGAHTSLGEPGDPGSGPVSPRGAAEGQQPFGGGGGGEGGEAAEGAAEGPHVEDPGMIVPGSRSHSSEGAEALAQAAAAMDAGLDPAQCRADAELEVAVLDLLADVVLTAAGTAPRGMKLRLIRAVDGGIGRPAEYNIRQVVTGANFSHVCLRKMYVLCSRGGASLGGGTPGDDGLAACLLEVAQLALPVLLARCDAMLRAYIEEGPHAAASSAAAAVPHRPRLDEVMCVLEVLASMTLVPEVVDAALTGNPPMQQLVALLRSRPEVSARGRERTHLLLLYPVLCEGITAHEARMREMVKDVLQLAGAELGLGMVGAGAASGGGGLLGHEGSGPHGVSAVGALRAHESASSSGEVQLPLGPV